VRLLWVVPVLRDDQRRTRWYRPPTAATDTRQQHRRSGIIAATCPAVRVRIMNPTLPVRFADATTYGRMPASVKAAARRVYRFRALTITLMATRSCRSREMSRRISWTSSELNSG
jgi:hypothetical protein